MTSRYEVNIQLLSEVLDDILVKSITDSSLAFLVILILVLLRICPKQVTQQSLIWNVAWSLYHLNVPVFVELLTEATVHAEDLVVDKGGNRQLLEHIYELLK